MQQRAHERGEVEVALERGGSAEPLVEGRHEEEREQHLHSRQRHSQLAHQLGQVAVQALELGLLPTLVHVPIFPGRTGGRVRSGSFTGRSHRFDIRRTNAIIRRVSNQVYEPETETDKFRERSREHHTSARRP